MSGVISAERSVMVVSDGGLTSLLACALAREAATTGQTTVTKRPPGVLFAPEGNETNLTRRQAVERHARLYQLASPDQLGELRGPGAHGLGQAETLRLVNAAYFAARHDFEIVVWPVQLGGEPGDVERVGRAADRALLVTRLVSLDAEEHGRPGIRVETPFVDLSDRQVIELAMDLNVPVDACWWWSDATGARGAEAERERARWTAVMRDLGWTREREPSPSKL